MSRTGGTEPSGIGARLRAARERLGWTREELAARSGLSWSAIAQVESGRRRNLRPGTLSGLAGALGVTIDYLVHGAPVGTSMLEHRALLYETDDDLVDTIAPFLVEGVERSETVLAITTPRNIDLLRERLGADAQRVEFVEREGWYKAPGPTLRELEGFVKEKLAAGAPWVRVVGEPIRTGASNPETRLWTRYESLLNLVLAQAGATIICPYDTRSVHPEIARQALMTHPHTVGPGGVAVSPEYADPAGFVLE